MRILASCLLAASAAVCGAQTSAAREADQTVKACGSPTKDLALKLPMTGLPARVLVYPRLAVYFTNNGFGGSRYMYARTKPGGAAIPDGQLSERMPCLAHAGLAAPL